MTRKFAIILHTTPFRARAYFKSWGMGSLVNVGNFFGFERKIVGKMK